MSIFTLPSGVTSVLTYVQKCKFTGVVKSSTHSVRGENCSRKSRETVSLLNPFISVDNSLQGKANRTLSPENEEEDLKSCSIQLPPPPASATQLKFKLEYLSSWILQIRDFIPLFLKINELLSPIYFDTEFWILRTKFVRESFFSWGKLAWLKMTFSWKLIN